MAKPSTISGSKVVHHCHDGVEKEFPTVSVERNHWTISLSLYSCIEGHLELPEPLKSNIFISPLETKIDHISSTQNLRHFNIEALKDFLCGDFIQHYQYHKRANATHSLKSHVGILWFSEAEHLVPWRGGNCGWLTPDVFSGWI